MNALNKQGNPRVSEYASQRRALKVLRTLLRRPLSCGLLAFRRP